MIRAVLDANVIVSAWMSSRGAPGRILTRFLQDRGFELIVSAGILSEVRRSLGYPRILKRIAASDNDLDSWVAALGFLADLVEDSGHTRAVAADPDDDKYLVAALAGRASHIVSGDHHLLDLGAYEGIPIVKPAAFLVLLGGR